MRILVLLAAISIFQLFHVWGILPDRQRNGLDYGPPLLIVGGIAYSKLTESWGAELYIAYRW